MVKKRGQTTSPGKANVTYPHWVKLRKFLAMQDPNSGLTEKKLESIYLGRGAGKPEQARFAPIPGIDVEKLSEEQMEELVMWLARGHKIEYILDRETGKKEPHVMMHSLSPHLMSGKAVKVKEFKESENTTSGQRTEVDIIKSTFYVSMLLCRLLNSNGLGRILSQ